jgi:hypothetical protein
MFLVNLYAASSTTYTNLCNTEYSPSAKLKTIDHCPPMKTMTRQINRSKPRLRSVLQLLYKGVSLYNCVFILAIGINDWRAGM